MKTGLILFSILFLACNNDLKQPQNSIVVNSLDSIRPKVPDSLSDPGNFYFLSNRPIEDNARLILIDSIYPSDNKITFDSMDSLSSANQGTRDYFFKVFIKILDKTDGALSEAVGIYALNYVEKYPKEFLQRTNKVDKKYFNAFANFVGYELAFLDDNGKSWIDSLNYRCSNCDSNQIKSLYHFKKIVQEAINEIKNNKRNSEQ